jgi:hypothetical protein
MAYAYKPTIANAEFAGHTFEEIRFAKNLEQSVIRFAEILRDERKGRSAMEFIEKMVIEAEELKNNETRRN